MFVSKIFLVSSLLLSVVFLLGCPDSLTKWDEGDKKGSEAITTSTDTATTTTETPSVDMVVYELTKEKVLNTNLTHKLHKGGNTTTSPSVECSVATVDSTTDVTTSEDILCWLDVEENDLHDNGINFALYVKPGICEYVGFTPFYFWQWKPGNSNSAEVFIETGDDSCVSTVGKNYEYTACKYDHSEAEGPNCDEGTYTARSWTDDADLGCISTSEVADCGGLHKNCYGGPGSMTEFSVDGVPVETVVPSLETGFDNRSSAWNFPAPLTSSLHSNLYLTNYLKMCVDEAHTYTYKTFEVGSVNSLFYFINSGSDIASTDSNGIDHAVDPLRNINPYYSFVCYDRAKDIKARIRVIVREWDRRFTSTDTALQQGNPDTGKADALMDTGGTEDSGLDFGPWNDFSDWEDLNLAPIGGGCTSHDLQNYTFPDYSL